jgi:hypothetical protein
MCERYIVRGDTIPCPDEVGASNFGGEGAMEACEDRLAVGGRGERCAQRDVGTVPGISVFSFGYGQFKRKRSVRWPWCERSEREGRLLGVVLVSDKTSRMSSQFE